MGGYISCVDDPAEGMQRLRYDMSHVKPLPIVWLVGPPGSGRNTQAKLISTNLEFSLIKVADLLRDEAGRDTDRGTVIREALHHRGKKVPDSLVVDLIKEEMLRCNGCHPGYEMKVTTHKGYLIDNFPRNSKQANMFIKEIGDVDAIIYLICDMPVMIHRRKIKSEGRLEDETIKKTIVAYTKEVKEGISKHGSKLEKIRGNEESDEVYAKIETAISARISAKTHQITAESDYAQEQSPSDQF